MDRDDGGSVNRVALAMRGSLGCGRRPRRRRIEFQSQRAREMVCKGHNQSGEEKKDRVQELTNAGNADDECGGPEF